MKGWLLHKIYSKYNIPTIRFLKGRGHNKEEMSTTMHNHCHIITSLLHRHLFIKFFTPPCFQLKKKSYPQLSPEKIGPFSLRHFIFWIVKVLVLNGQIKIFIIYWFQKGVIKLNYISKWKARQSNLVGLLRYRGNIGFIHSVLPMTCMYYCSQQNVEQ